MAAMLAGVPFSAISPAYSMISKILANKHVFDHMTPGMVYANDGQAFAKAIQSYQTEIKLLPIKFRYGYFISITVRYACHQCRSIINV